MRRIKNIILLCFGIILFLSRINSAQEIVYKTLPGSKMWIEGTSTLNVYTCKTDDVNGYAELYNARGENDTSLGKDKANLLIMVKSLNCGKDLMNEDMYNAMKSGEFPFISYELLSARLVSHADSADGWFDLETRGKLSIAGDTNTVVIIMKIKKMTNHVYRLVGSKALSMRDFGIIPPSHFFGLIKARKGLTVHFDLLAAGIASNDFATHNHPGK